ncbi:MAG: ROK family protein, partial [Saprospiraceae bacterium]|nr:ROK family protein [Saprospiraceae bacterium]
MEILGLDIGGTGIKGGMVNLKSGEMVSERFRLNTPKPSLPKAVAETAAKIIEHFDYQGIVGCGFPAIVKNGTAHSAANIHSSWIGTHAEELISKESGCQIFACNDADVAGLAEMRFGAGKGKSGSVLLITIGTGLGSALFTDGKMV